MTHRNSHTHCQAAQANRKACPVISGSQSLSKSVSEPTHGRMKRKYDFPTMSMRNAGESADMKLITLNKLTAKR